MAKGPFAVVADSLPTRCDGTPWLIQGGMGIAISGSPLARAVSLAGQLGVVSGTAIDNVFVRRLQNFGVSESLREVLEKFPVPTIVESALAKFATARRRAGEPFKTLPMLTHLSKRSSIDLVVLASFVEVALAKSGHDGIIGMNLLTKVQLPTAAALCGAILAGVDYILMGAGVPTHIPGTLDQLSRGEAVDTPFSVEGASEPLMLHFDPAPYLSGLRLRRPKFLGIVSSNVLATALARRSNGVVDGLVVERPNAGGHNAPPRGRYDCDEGGNPIYGPRDDVDYEALTEIGLPYWIGGGITSPEDVRAAMDLGAAGVQVGTLFAYCRESGMEPSLRDAVTGAARSGTLTVTTSTRASSTGYPFKVVSVPGTVSEPTVYASRERRCDLGYLRVAAVAPNGSVAYRCAAEPVAAYVRKGGDENETTGSACLCNGLMATCGLAQVRADGREEPPIVTSGDEIGKIADVMGDRPDYGALDVIEFLSAGLDGVVSPSVRVGDGHPAHSTV